MREQTNLCPLCGGMCKDMIECRGMQIEALLTGIDELVEAAKEVCVWLENWDLPFQPEDEWEDDLNRLSAAIQKYGDRP